MFYPRNLLKYPLTFFLLLNLAPHPSEISGYQTSYGAVPGMPPQTTQPPPAGVYPPYGGPYPPQQPAGAYGKAGGAPVGAGPYPLSQPGYANSNSASYQTNYVYPTQSVVLVGGCPACRVGESKGYRHAMRTFAHSTLAFQFSILNLITMLLQACWHGSMDFQMPSFFSLQSVP